jgi:hypothetical protein
LKYRYFLLTCGFLGIEFLLYQVATSLINSSDDVTVVVGFVTLLIGGPLVLIKYVDVLNRWSQNA